MTTLEQKLEKAKDKRAALIAAEANLLADKAEKIQEARRAELAELLEATLPKVERAAALRVRLIELLDKSDQITAQQVVPAWNTLHKAATKGKAVLEASCRKQGLPAPNYRNGMKELTRTAPWVPLPLLETTNPHTGEVTTTTHPAYKTFGQAFVTVWQAREKNEDAQND